MKTEFKDRLFSASIRFLLLGAAAVILLPALAHAAATSGTISSSTTDSDAVKPPSFSHSQGAQAARANAAAASAVPAAATDPSKLVAAAVPAAVALPAPATPATANASGLHGAEVDVPENVKNVIKTLDSSAENVTVEDLNSARQAIAKVEILIELEKKLTDLQKARAEREGRSTIAGAIPASALGGVAGALPGGPTDMMPSSLDILRIVGGAGHYKVVVKGFDGSPKTLSVGDVISDGSVISSISATSATLDKKGEEKVVRIKNVDKIFSGTP